MRRIALWLSFALVLVIPLENAFFVAGMGRLSKLVGLLVGVAWLLAVAQSRAVRRPRAVHLTMLAFVGWCILSIMWSVDIDSSRTRALTYLQVFGMALILWDLYESPSDLRRALQAYVLGTWVPVVSAINNFFTARETFYYQRYSASGFHVDDLGHIVALAIPISWFLAITRDPGRRGRLFAAANWAFTPPAVFTVFLTASRSSILALLPSLVFAVVLVFRHRPHARVRILIASILALVAVAPFVPDTSVTRFIGTKDEVTTGDFNGRLAIWREGVDIFATHPILGIGTGAFRTANVDLGKAGHNLAISLLAEVGLPGFLLFSVILYLAIKDVFGQSQALRSLWITLLMIWGLGAMTHNWEARKQTWLLFALIVVASHLRGVAPESGPEAARTRLVTAELRAGAGS